MADEIDEWPTGRLLSTAARLVENAWQEALAAHDLTHAGLIVLHYVREAPIGQSALAVRARVENQTMSRTIERLERSGYVSRERDARDGRRQLVSMTDAGASVFDQISTVEADLFPAVEKPDVLRAQLAAIIRASRRWAE